MGVFRAIIFPIASHLTYTENYQNVPINSGLRVAYVQLLTREFIMRGLT